MDPKDKEEQKHPPKIMQGKLLDATLFDPLNLNWALYVEPSKARQEEHYIL